MRRVEAQFSVGSTEVREVRVFEVDCEQGIFAEAEVRKAFASDETFRWCEVLPDGESK